MEPTTVRQGPRPLPLHLMATLLAWQSLPAAWSAWRSGSLNWSENLKPRAEALQTVLAASRLDDEKIAASLIEQVRQRGLKLAEALLTYRHHPYRRDLPRPAEVWRDGTSSLLDYSPSGGKPLFVIPSLVNRGYVLDLSQRTSFLRWLVGQGFRPLLIDWDRPGAVERRFTLTDYVMGRLAPALEKAAALSGAAPAVLGYCMGGNLALALTLQRPQLVSRLILMATPWDFHAENAAGAKQLAGMASLYGPIMESLGELPVDLVQSLFMLLDPLLMAKKFQAFQRLDPSSEKAAAFVALEDWLNDGVGLAAPVARECLTGWYGENTPAKGEWRIAGRPVDPTKIACPTLVLVPEADRIVPPAAALALSAAIPGAQVHTPPLGHIGMVVSSAAKEKVWEVVKGWV